jgi:hypothetical protein
MSALWSHPSPRSPVAGGSTPPFRLTTTGRRGVPCGRCFSLRVWLSGTIRGLVWPHRNAADAEPVLCEPGHGVGISAFTRKIQSFILETTLIHCLS